MQRKHSDLLPGSFLLLLAVDAVTTENKLAPTSSQLCTGWLSVSTIREKVRQMADAGYLNRIAPRPRAARQLVLTGKGLGVVYELKRALRDSARQLAPTGRWPVRW